MQELLNNPAVQGGVAPFLAALLVAFALFAVRLAGLALVAGLGTAVWLIGGFAFPPVSAQQKILVIALAVPLVGLVVDLAFKPTRAAGPILGLLFGLVALWVGINVLKQKEGVALLAAAAGIVALVGWITAANFSLRGDPVRAGAAGVTLGLGLAVAAFLSASGSYAQYGAAVGAGAGGFLMVQLLLGRAVPGGATFALSAGVGGGMLVAGAALASPLPWYAAAALGLVPAAVLLPLPRGGIWLQAVVASLYGGIAAAAACLLAWPEVQQRLGL